MLGEGHYQLRMVGTDDSDQQYSAITDFYVDNSGSRDSLHTALNDVLKHIDF